MLIVMPENLSLGFLTSSPNICSYERIRKNISSYPQIQISACAYFHSYSVYVYYLARCATGYGRSLHLNDVAQGYQVIIETAEACPLN